jgi:hypothetical protein
LLAYFVVNCKSSKSYSKARHHVQILHVTCDGMVELFYSIMLQAALKILFVMIITTIESLFSICFLVVNLMLFYFKTMLLFNVIPLNSSFRVPLKVEMLYILCLQQRPFLFKYIIPKQFTAIGLASFISRKGGRSRSKNVFLQYFDILWKFSKTVCSFFYGDCRGLSRTAGISES